MSEIERYLSRLPLSVKLFVSATLASILIGCSTVPAVGNAKEDEGYIKCVVPALFTEEKGNDLGAVAEVFNQEGELAGKIVADSTQYTGFRYDQLLGVLDQVQLTTTEPQVDAVSGSIATAWYTRQDGRLSAPTALVRGRDGSEEVYACVPLENLNGTE